MKFSLLLILAFSWTFSFSQEVSDSLKIEMFEFGMKNYFGEPKEEHAIVHIVNDTIVENLALRLEGYQIQVVDSQQIYSKIKKSDIQDLNRLKFDQWAKDTIDFDVISTSVSHKKVFRFRRIEGKIRLIRNAYYFAVACGGNGIPTARFIFNHEKKKWQFYGHSELYDLKYSKTN